MKKKVFLGCLIIISLLLKSNIIYGQMSVKNLILPNGKSITWDKMDSVEKAWGGKNRVSYQHDDKDDQNHVMRLVRITDEEMNRMNAEKLKHAQEVSAMLNHPAPAWTAKDINGKSITLEAFKGKVVVLNFWFTHCPPCIAEMPDLNKLVSTYEGKDVVFLAITFDNDKQVRDFLENHEFKFKQLPNSSELCKLNHIASFPTSMVINKKGVLTYMGSDTSDEKSLLSKEIDSAAKSTD